MRHSNPLAIFAIMIVTCMLNLFGLGHAADVKSMKAGEALTAGLRVKVSGANVVTAGAAEEDIGVVLGTVASGAPVAVVMAKEGECVEMTASGAITIGADVYPAASGKISATVSGKRIGKALKAAAQDGDKIEVLRLATSLDRVVITKTFAAASVDDWLFIADRPYTVVSIKEVHSVAGTDGGAVTAALRKVTDASAPGAGAGATVKELLTGTFNLKSTANTTVTATLTGTAADLDLASGDKIGMDLTGTLTSLAGGLVVIELKPK